MNSLKEKALEDETVQEVLQTGTDLRKYSREIEKELMAIENKSIKDYIKESQNIASLHNQICDCDSILERMENMLVTFQSDLGSISSEIILLQKKSVQMSQQLSNRQAVRAPLSQFIDDISVSETLINSILDIPVTDKVFLSQLMVLNHKINFVKEQSFKDARCSQDVMEVLEKLRIKAVTKIRLYLLEQVSKFRKPLANYQVPQGVLLKNKFLFEFLMGQERNTAAEISAEYVDTMSKVYYSYFKSYDSRLMKLQYEEGASKDDLMGIEDTASRGGLFHKTTLKHKTTVFTIGNRGEVLTTHLEAPVIVPHAAQKSGTKYPYEALFRSEQYALLDNACREYLFLSEFFMVKTSQALQIFNQVFGKTLKMLLKALETYVETSYDSIALFLCAHITIRYKLLCHKRSVSALDTYWDSLQDCIWQRCQHVLELNIQSIKDCDPLKLGREIGPHYVARRYAELSGAMIGLSETFPCDVINNLLGQLQEEVELFLLKMAAVFPQRKEQLIFLINNYDMILSVLMERTKDHSKEAETFREQLTTRSNEYVEEILSPHFGGIMQFVREGESLLEKDHHEELKQQEGKALQLVQAFSNTWKKSLEELQSEVLRSFPSLVTGGALLQLALTTLVQYYHRFHKLLTPNARGQLTNIHHIMVETCLSYKPVFIIHGILSKNVSMTVLEDRIKQAHLSTEVFICNRYNSLHSLEPMWLQVDKIGNELMNISSRYPEGIHLIGYSQGGLIARGVLEKFPNHNVKTFISLSSPQAGQYGTKFLHLIFPNLVKEKAYKIFYTPAGQLTSVGNYWNDPHQQKLYYSHSVFLPIINNEIASRRDPSYTEGLMKLKKLVLIGGPDDEVITPWQSSIFGYYNEDESVEDFKDRKIYTEDYFGLKTLDREGKLKVVTVSGVKHLFWRKNLSVIDNHILPYLD